MNNVLKFVYSEKLKSFVLALVPLTLFISIKWNSIVIIIILLFFIKDIVLNSRKGVVKNKKLFLPPLFYVLSIFFGFIIDSYYNINSVKTIERTLSVIIFPLIFFSRIKNQFESFKIIKIYSYIITLCNIILFVLATYFTIQNIFKNQFLDDLWVKSGTSVIIDSLEIGPKNKNNVAKIIENQGYGSHDLVFKLKKKVIKDTNYTRSIFLKKAERDWVLIRQFDGVNHKGAWFNLSEGYVGKIEKGLIGEIEDFGKGWYRCTLINRTNKKATTERIQVTIVDNNGNYKYKGDGNSGIYIWGAELYLGNKIKSEVPSVYNFDLRFFFREKILKPLDTHPTYYSIYLITAIIFFILTLLRNFKFSTLFFLIFNVLFLILISSKGALLSFVIILFFLSLIHFNKSKTRFLILITFIITFSMLIFNIPTVQHRIEQTIETILHNKNDELSTSKRLIVWNAIFNFKKKDLIFGKGNIGGELEIRKNTKLILNAHNQYLQALISSGVIGLLFLLIFLFSPLFYVKNFNSDLAIFATCLVILFGINFLFESILNRQWGIVFIAYFYSLLIIELKNIKNFE